MPQRQQTSMIKQNSITVRLRAAEPRQYQTIKMQIHHIMLKMLMMVQDIL